MSLRYLLDTNICIYIIKQRPISVLKKFETLHVREVAMSAITYGELLYGIQKSQQAKKSLLILDELITLISPLPIPITASRYYGDVRSKLDKQGVPIGGNDLWIAAHALASKLTLVTNNVKEFSRVPNLKIENWV